MTTTKARTPSAVARWEREKAEYRRLVLESVELRKSGYSFRAIGEHQGCSIHTAIKRYNKGIKEYVPPELVEAARATEIDRFDALVVMNHTLLVKAYQAGDVDAVCKLQDKLLAIHDRRAKLIPIQVPTRLVVDATVEHTTDQDRELADLLSGMSQEVEDKINDLRENAAP